MPTAKIETSQSPAPAIRKKALAFTARMAFISIVGLFSSRMVLNALGVEGYGIYNAVAALVWTFTFLNSSVHDATTRFITFSIGKDSPQKARRVFSTSLWLHCATALLIIATAETAGLWYLDNRLVIPPDNLPQAKIVFHIILATITIGFITLPFKASTLAHERFRFYGRLEIANIFLSLLILIPLAKYGLDKLTLYATLLLAVQILITGTYVAFSLSRFQETHPLLYIDRPTMKGLLKFSGCGIYGNACVSAYTYLNPLVLNMFFGVEANTPASLALTFAGVIAGLTYGITQTYSPYITKAHAASDSAGMTGHICDAIHLTLCAFGVLLIPTALFMPRILEAWLGDVPPHTATFAHFAIVTAMCGAVTGIINTAIHATGDIRRLSFINGTLYLLCPALSWIAYRTGAWISAMFAIELAIAAIILLNGCLILKFQLPALDSRKYHGIIIRDMSVIFAFLAVAWLIGLVIIPRYPDFFVIL